MPGVDKLLQEALKGGLGDVLSSEEVALDAFRDLLKDEVKRKVREALDENPDLRREVKDAVGMYFEARVRQAYATLRLAKASAKLGVVLLPDHLRDELGKEFAQTFEKEIGVLLEKSL